MAYREYQKITALWRKKFDDGLRFFNEAKYAAAYNALHTVVNIFNIMTRADGKELSSHIYYISLTRYTLGQTCEKLGKTDEARFYYASVLPSGPFGQKAKEGLDALIEPS